VRARTTIIAVLTFAIAAGCAGVVLIWSLRSALVDEVDRSIDSRAADIAAQVESERSQISLGPGIGSDTLAVVFSTDRGFWATSDESADIGALMRTAGSIDEPFDVDLGSLGSTVGADNLRAVVLVVPAEDALGGEQLDDDAYDLLFDLLDGFVTLDELSEAELASLGLDPGVLDSGLSDDEVLDLVLEGGSPTGDPGSTGSPGREELSPDDYIIYVATTLDGVDRTVSEVTTGVLVAIPSLVLFVGLITWVLAGRALRPVEAIRSEVEDISAFGLHRRVPEPSSGDEVGRLAATMNDMLSRLELSQKSQQQLVADASHELRSPLAAMQARVDVGLHHRDVTNWVEVGQDLLRYMRRMQRLVDDLLFLARSDARSQDVLIGDLLDLDDLVFETVAGMQSQTQVGISTAHVSAGLVRGHRDQLQRLIRNLLDNGVRHAASVVELTLTETDEDVVLTVTDDGEGIDPEEWERIFDRFVRLDEARSRDGGGSGLGLAISREIAAAHGGGLTVSASAIGGAKFVLALPRAVDLSPDET
jgi:signal transduction histidine kinase